MEKHISGIQQIGIGIPKLHEAWKWYRTFFGMDVPVFDDAGTAGLMLPYTGGNPHDRHAILAWNLHGGSGFEIWQYTSREPVKARFEIKLGDYGIFGCRIKCHDVKATYEQFKKNGGKIPGGLQKDPAGNPHFFIEDPYGNFFQVVPGTQWYSKSKKLTGGASGAMIGVSDIEKSRKLYSDILGYDTVVYDETGVFGDLKALPGGDMKFRRVLLKHRDARKGKFSHVMGPSQLELFQVSGREPNKIFEDRYWGDLGFIHLCFDVVGMKALKAECENNGFPFTVDSSKTFDMGEAAGHFSYIEDPDGTLIEFVETHRIPIIKKLGWYMNFNKRDPLKPIPGWIFKALSLSRVKD